MGIIWLKTPVIWHSSRVPSGYNYSAMTDEQIHLIGARWHNWYTADWDYGLPTIYFFSAGIIVFALLQALSLFRSSRPRASAAKAAPSALDRFTASVRYLSSRQFKLVTASGVEYYSPTLGVILSVSSIIIFIFAIMLAVRPFYWPSMEMGHSQPIATRSGWISIAIMPFMIAFATKVNPIGFIIKVSHEKLQVYHRWTATVMYVTSLVHTFPFIVMAIREGEMVLNWKTSPFYWSGVAALVPQTYLIFTSWGIIRNPYYEIFKKLHFVAATIFMIALFLHCNFRLSSWDYFWATLAIYMSSWLGRFFRSLLFNSNLIGLPATVQQLPDDMVHVSVKVPSRIKWKPGQHVFVRFLGGGVGAHALTSHPFSITTLSNASEDERNLGLVFRAYGGITRRLYNLSKDKAGVATRVIIDGPYGGIPISLRSFDTVYLFAGGSGATMVVPLLLDLVHGFENGMACKHVEFILAVRGNESPIWMKDQLAEARRVAQHHKLILHIHVTRTDADPAILPDTHHDKMTPSISEEDKKSSISQGSTETVEADVRNGRPKIPEIIREAARTSTGRIGIAACGPDSLLYDVRNAVAESQLELLDGFGTCKEIFLHAEHYTW